MGSGSPKNDSVSFMQGLTQATYINFFYRLAAVKGFIPIRPMKFGCIRQLAPDLRISS